MSSSMMPSSGSFSNLFKGTKPSERLPTYQYSKLKTPASDIRLISLHPGDFGDDIRITINSTSLAENDQKLRPGTLLKQEELQKTLPADWKVFTTRDDVFIFVDETSGKTSWAHPDPTIDPSHYQLPQEYPNPQFEPKYEALSYTWGSSKKPDFVLVDSSTETKCLRIGHNLFVALRALRYPDKSRTLWNDAICINQEDLTERGEQVGRMASIYSSAYRVIVWLGVESADSKLACDTIETIGSQVELSNDYTFRFQTPGCTEPDFWRAEKPLPFSKRQWESLNNLLQRPWFSRLWIWQEIQLSNRRAIVQCGSDQFRWSVFRRAMICLREKHEGVSSEFLVRVNNISDLLGLIKSSQVNELLGYGALRQCSDPRDRVYALLGIADPSFASKIRPQYSLSKAEVYKRAVLAHINLYRSLELMTHCCIVQWEPYLPTWVPNWSGPKRPNSSGVYYWASGNSSANTQFPSPNILEITGIKCARITSVQAPSGDTLLDMIDASGLRTQSEVSPETKYVTGESRSRAIISTLAVYRTKERFPDYEEYPSLDNLEKIFLAKLSRFRKKLDTTSLSINWLTRMTRYLAGRVFFETAEGHIGMGFKGTKPGDILSVLLGCNLPMLLRPTTSGHYRVVGECYVHGLCDGEALLGPLMDLWKVEAFSDLSGIYWQMFANASTNTTTGLDPRLGPLPSDWEGIQHPQLPGAQFPLFNAFKNKSSGEITPFDPRLTPEYLEARGVKLMKFQLV